jgi:hypothetical protein
MKKENHVHGNRGLPALFTAVFLAAVLAVALGATPAGAIANPRTRTVSSERDTPVVVVLLGHTKSEAGETNQLVDMLRDVVIPNAASIRARVIVGLVSDESATRPKVAADTKLDVGGRSGGNPHYEQELLDDATDDLVARVQKVVARRTAAPASDYFGAFAWAADVLDQFPKRSPKQLVTLGDLLNTAGEGCNLSARDLSGDNTGVVINQCTHSAVPHLAGVRVSSAGVGLGAPPALVPALRTFWSSYFDAAGARIDCWAATLVTADCMSGAR